MAFYVDYFIVKKRHPILYMYMYKSLILFIFKMNTTKRVYTSVQLDSAVRFCVFDHKDVILFILYLFHPRKTKARRVPSLLK